MHISDQMSPVTHALLPVFLGRRILVSPGKSPSWSDAGLVALAGALPDLLSPHLSLDARYVAYSHTAWAFLGFSLLVWGASIRWSRLMRLRLLCLFAYAAHLACDLISGGVALFYPLSTVVHGGNYLPYWMWGASDGLLLIYLYLVYRWLPLRHRISARKVLEPGKPGPVR
ncbi:hypothetical protein BH23VER1_BH23VER1_24760 [soil metagenome]